MQTIRTKAVTALRMMAVDAIQKANSGHPGAPLGLADVAMTVWEEFLRFDPRDPKWPGRDRFVLSGGHGSALLYSLLHLFGYDLPLEQIQSFRQWDSKTPGHPEVGMTPGVELTTGPLGHGAATSVGMALAAKHVNALVDVADDDFQAMGQRVFAIMGDGDLMEGISYEAASLAGHWRLDNLVWLYDDNKITIDGTTELAFTEDVAKRFEAAGWKVLHADGCEHASIQAALREATTNAQGPVLIICRTHIGFGSPNRADTSGVHGTPLGEEELRATKKNLGWPEDAHFLVPEDVAAYFKAAIDRKIADRANYEAQLSAWRERHPDKAAVYDSLWNENLPADLEERLVEATPKSGATRVLSNASVKAAMAILPGLCGGSADLSGSNGLKLNSENFGAPGWSKAYNFTFAGRQVPFGIREHAMGAITNGMSLFGALIPFGGTFHVFSDYERPAIRLAALSNLRNIFVLTHDSIFLGEDGPTHQPIEHHWALRVIPNLEYWRPADGTETAIAWAAAIRRTDGPVAMALTRQKVPELQQAEGFEIRDIERGGYVVEKAENPDVVFLATGSEVGLAINAAKLLREAGKSVRVISMPCVERFMKQSKEYQDSVIPSNHNCIVTVEAGVTGPWHQFNGRNGLCIGLDHFGASAPDTVLAEKFGFTPKSVADRVLAHLATL